MGIEIEIDSLEEMCALMCDNYIPEDKKKRGAPDDSGNAQHHVDDIITL